MADCAAGALSAGTATNVLNGVAAVSRSQVWAVGYSYNGSADKTLATSPSGNLVYVTGVSYAPGSVNDYATIAYNAATGAQVWVRRYNGPASNDDGASSVAVSPVSGAVYVTGESLGRSGSLDYLTAGYAG